MKHSAVLLAIGVLGVPAVYAANLGLQFGGTCVAGTCPAQILGVGGSALVPISASVTLPNGDGYTILGALFAANNANGSIGLNYQFQVIYAGNGRGGAAQADTLTLRMLSAFQSTLTGGTFDLPLAGAFGPTIAASSVQMCLATSCTNRANSPGPFNAPLPFSAGATGGVLAFDFTITVNFGAGSPQGSYILFGAPLPTPAIRQNQGAISAGAFGAFSSIAPGSWIEIYGSDFSLGSVEWAGVDFAGTNAPTTLGGARVTIGGKAAFVDFASTGQVNAQVPFDVGLGPQQLIVTTAGGSSTPYPVTVNSTQPGLLAPASFNLSGTQNVVALFPSGEYVLPPGAIFGVASRRARPGDTITMYGVGFGAVNPNIPAGQIVGQSNALAANVTVSFAGTQASIPYAGLAPNFVGLYQFNVVVPNVPPSDRVPLTFNLGGASGTQTLFIAIGN